MTLEAPLDGTVPLMARAGSAIPVDLAHGGFRPEPFRRGLWLFPLAEDGVFSWSFTEDEGERDAEHGVWTGDCVCEGDVIGTTVRRDGPGTFGDASITILLRLQERRRLEISGATWEAVEIEGRRGARVTLAPM